MSAKFPHIHRLTVSEPLLCFNSLTMDCGAEISQASLMWMVRDTKALLAKVEEAIESQIFVNPEARETYRDMQLRKIAKRGLSPEFTCEECRLLPGPEDPEETYNYGVVDLRELREWEKGRGRECGQGDAA